MDDMIITREGLRRLGDELERLRTEGRRSIAERLARAVASEANREENAELLETKEEQALLEQRIAVLEERLRSSLLVEPQPGNGRIDVGERVRIRDLSTGERLDLELVGPFDSD